MADDGSLLARLGEGLAANALRAVLDSVRDGIVVCDAVGETRYLNGAARRICGLPERGPSSHERCDWFHADGVTQLSPDQLPLVRALSEGLLTHAEVVIVPRGGNPRRVVASGRAILAEEGAVVGAVVSLHEVGDRSQLVRERVQLAELEEQLEHNRTRTIAKPLPPRSAKRLTTGPTTQSIFDYVGPTAHTAG